MDGKFIDRLYKTHQEMDPLPSRSAICKFTEGLLDLLFPQLSEKSFHSKEELSVYADILTNDLKVIFLNTQSYLDKPAEEIVNAFFEFIKKGGC